MNLSDLILTSAQAEDANAEIPDILSAIRHHLRMDVAFVAQFDEGRRVFRHVDSEEPDQDVKVGEGAPLEDTYCQRVVDGRLPQLMTNARQNPEAAKLPPPHRAPVGAHLSVPLRMSDGKVYGTFCAFSYEPDYSLNERDLQMMRVFAELAARIIERSEKKNQSAREAMQRIEAVMMQDQLSVVFQPIWNLAQKRVIGFEALSRFSALPQRTPDLWFQEANVVGLSGALEKHAASSALRGLKRIPPPLILAVNMSPEQVLDDTLAHVLDSLPLSRLVLEITEHTAVAAYQDLEQKLKPLRERGMQLAIDDAGAGYASFRHILNLKPDRIKLDMSITRNIDSDPARRALAAAFVRFADETGTTLIAEGVETEAEMKTLKELGVAHGQGNYLSPPLNLDRALALVPRALQASNTAALRSAGQN